jgi:hypothetical protein
MLGGYEFVVGLCAEVFDVVDEERVGERLSNEQDYLRTARGQPSDDFSAYACCSALTCVSDMLSYCIKNLVLSQSPPWNAYSAPTC